MTCVCSPWNNTFNVIVEVHTYPPWRKVGVGIGCFYVMCCEPLLLKLSDTAKYY